DDRPSATKGLRVHGWDEDAERHGRLRVYGSDAPAIVALEHAEPALAEPLHPSLPYTGAQVVWAARREMARTVEDVLSRRLRATFLNARAALAMAPRVAELLARELGRDAAWARGEAERFRAVGAGYVLRVDESG